MWKQIILLGILKIFTYMQGMIIAGHTPTNAEEELPFNDGNVYRSYDENLDCIFYNIDCGCAERKKHPNGKPDGMRLENETFFYVV